MVRRPLMRLPADMVERVSDHPKRGEALNFRVSPGLRARLETQADRYDQTITSLFRIALVIGVEVLEATYGRLSKIPEDPGEGGT